jgi:hypothetical protein
MYSQSFLDALATGKAVVRRIFKNENRKGQVTVQFMQELDTDQDESSMNLIAMAQGLGSKQRVTVLFSFAENVVYEKAQLADGDYFDGEEVVYANELFGGKEVSIRVFENFSPNEYRASHEPKKNPTSGEVITFFDQPVYRHTELVGGTQDKISHAFIRNEEDARKCLNIPNGSIALAASRIKYEEAMKEVPAEEQEQGTF